MFTLLRLLYLAFPCTIELVLTIKHLPYTSCLTVVDFILILPIFD